MVMRHAHLISLPPNKREEREGVSCGKPISASAQPLPPPPPLLSTADHPIFPEKRAKWKKERGRSRREINFGTYWQLILRGIEILRFSTNMWETYNCFSTYSSFPWRNICVEKEGNRGECECVCTSTICRHLPAGGMDGTAGAGKKVSEEGPSSLFCHHRQLTISQNKGTAGKEKKVFPKLLRVV